MRRNAFLILSLIMALGFFAIAQTSQAVLTVDGTPGGAWSNSGTMVYDDTQPDPTSISGDQYMILNGASLTMNSGTFTLTDNRWGTFIGQTSASQSAAGMLVLNGGNLTVNSNGTDEQRLAVGNGSNLANPGLGILDINDGYCFLHTGAGSDADRGFLIGRDGGTGTVNIADGILTTDTDRFGMGGKYSGASFAPSAAASGIINFNAGSGTIIFHGLMAIDTTAWNFNSSSYINWTSGSLGTLSVGTGTSPAPQSFFDGMVTAGQIKIDGLAATPSQFAYSVQGTQGVYQLAVPEPSTLALLALAAISMVIYLRRNR